MVLARSGLAVRVIIGVLTAAHPKIAAEPAPKPCPKPGKKIKARVGGVTKKLIFLNCESNALGNADDNPSNNPEWMLVLDS